MFILAFMKENQFVSSNAVVIHRALVKVAVKRVKVPAN